ncbi:MAG: tetratricopeptide repeat protein, partial [Bdellovibrionales bacterium]
EVSSYWRSRALAFMVENPLRTIELVFNKALAFWNGTEQFDNYDTAFIEQNFDTLLSWPLVPYWLVTALGMAGAVLLWPTHKRKVFFLLLFLAAYMGSLLLFYVTDRYRLPAIVFLIPMAGAGLTAFYSKIRNRLWSGLALAGLAGGFFLFLGVRPPLYPVDLTAFNWGTLCMVYSDLEQDQKAIEAFTKATAVSPLKAGAGAYVRVSYAYEHLGQDAQAKQALDRAIQLFPQSGIVLYNYARFLAARSQLDQALVFFEKASKLSPFYLLNYYALAKGYAIKGNKESALAFAEQGLRIDPSDPLLNQAKAEIIGESR